MKLVTVHVKPPIPTREFDWCAYDADADLCFDADCSCRRKFAQGNAATEEQAIVNFVRELLKKREVPMPIDECADQLERMLRDAYDASANT